MKLALIALTVLNMLIAMGWRHQARLNAQALRLVALNGTEDGTYELCPVCEGTAGGCINCFDESFVPHGCGRKAEFRDWQEDWS